MDERAIEEMKQMAIGLQGMATALIRIAEALDNGINGVKESLKDIAWAIEAVTETD